MIAKPQNNFKMYTMLYYATINVFASILLRFDTAIDAINRIRLENSTTEITIATSKALIRLLKYVCKLIENSVTLNRNVTRIL